MKRLRALLHAKPLVAANLLAAALVALPSQVSAQVGEATGIAEPGRAQERFRQEMIIPREAPDISVSGIALQRAPEGAQEVIFKLGGIEIEGATAFGEKALAKFYEGRIGTEVSLADVYGIANQMSLAYHNDGYVLTQVVVPPQTIESGVVRLQVVEGFIDKITVQPAEGEGRHAIETIKRYAAQISKSKPLNVRSLERQLLLINDLPGVRARCVLGPSKTTQGAADILIIVERKPYDAQLSVDDYGSRYLGPIQWGAAGTLNSPFGLNDAITGQVSMAHDSDSRELGFASAGYEMPVGDYGTKASISVSTTHTTPGFDLEQFNVRGRSNLVSLKATHPFIRNRSENLIGHVLFDWRNVASQNDLETTRHDFIRQIRAGAQYEFLDWLLGVGSNVVDFEISKGVNVLGSSQQGDANMTRNLADPEATKAVLDVQSLRRITPDINLLVEGHGQMSTDALLSSEEFAVGGWSLGRGYDPSEITGDDGISGRLELQWTNPGQLHSVYYERYQAYGFYDIGSVWNADATTSADGRNSLASTGLGVRFNFVQNVQGDIAVAFPLTETVRTQGNKHPKLYFSLNKKF